MGIHNPSIAVLFGLSRGEMTGLSSDLKSSTFDLCWPFDYWLAGDKCMCYADLSVQIISGCCFIFHQWGTTQPCWFLPYIMDPAICHLFFLAMQLCQRTLKVIIIIYQLCIDSVGTLGSMCVCVWVCVCMHVCVTAAGDHWGFYIGTREC